MTELRLALPDELLEAIAQRVAAILAERHATTPAEPERLLTVTEAAQRAGIHPETVRRAIRAGALTTAGQVGRSPRLAWVDVAAWLEGGRGRSKKAPPDREMATPRARNGTSKRVLAAAFEEASRATCRSGGSLDA